MRTGRILTGAYLYFVECNSLAAAHEYVKLQSDFLGRRLRIVGTKKISEDCFRVLFMTDTHCSDQMHVADLFQFIGNADWIEI